jgi:hypothetical protein
MNKEELAKALESIIGKSISDWDDLDIKVKDNNWTEKGRSITIEISKMYDYVRITFAMLKELSELFGTDFIDFGDKTSMDGCDTCNHGSCYTERLEISHIGIHLEKMS